MPKFKPQTEDRFRGFRVSIAQAQGAHPSRVVCGRVRISTSCPIRCPVKDLRQVGPLLPITKLEGALFLRVFCEKWGFSRGGLSRDPNLHLQYGPIIHHHRPSFSLSIGPEAAPLPLVGSFHQPALDGVAVNVAQLLNALARAPHIEVVEAPLPEAPGRKGVKQHCAT